MAVRGITEGDRVHICINDDSDLNFYVRRKEVWTVTHTPCDTGDSWHLALAARRVSINPNSANFDGLVLITPLETSDGS